MNFADVRRALSSGSFIVNSILLLLAGLVVGYVGGGSDAILRAGGPGTANAVATAWVLTIFALGMARGCSLSVLAEDRFAGLLEAPLARPVTRFGLVFARFGGVVIALAVGSLLGAIGATLGYAAGGRGAVYPSSLTVNLGVGLFLAGLAMAAICFLVIFTVRSAPSARWATRGIFWLVFIVAALLLSLSRASSLLIANPLLLALNMSANAIPYAPPPSLFPILFAAYQGVRIGTDGTLAVGLLWCALLIGLVAYETRTSDLVGA